MLVVTHINQGDETMSATTTAVAVRTYQIDKTHSEVAFRVRHLLTKVRGRFTDFDGSLDYNAAEPEQSAVRFTARTASIDTSEPKRDEHLRSADFFDADVHPQLTFVSRRITRRGEETFDVEGDLSIHGVTRPVVLPVTLLGTARDPWGNDRLGLEAETTINRKDYGLNWNAALETGGFLVGDDVTIHLQIQAVGQ
jgi:polyisoprenoid-binding protein YceI